MAMQGLSLMMGERNERRGSIVLVLLVAAGLIVAAAGLMVVGRGQAGPYVIVLLAVLGVVGVFSLFALAAGVLRVSGRDAASSVLDDVVENAHDGIVVTDGSGRVLYANTAYRAFADASGLDDVRPVERVFVGDPDVSEAVYRLLKAAQEGRRLQEEVRIAGMRGEPARWLRMRVRPLGAARDAKTSVWTVADVTRDRERQENVFQELQHAIDYLDHAPAGFFSAEANGDIGYVNATLAGWLDYDLAQVGSGGLRLADILPADSAAMLTTLSARPGEVKTDVLDLDLRRRDGRTLPARLYHKVAFAADATPGASRTLVLNRASGDGADPLRAAEVRFSRFFNNTPMAIATVDRDGRIARRNAPFAHLFQTVLKGEAAQNGSIRTVVAERDRAAIDAALLASARGAGDIAPIDAALAGEGERSARFYITPVDEAERDAEAAIVYAIETTDQRTLQRQFDTAQKMDSIGKLAGGLAHDFNNILSSILMAADFLLAVHRPTDPSFQDIMQIKQDANRAAGLVKQLLAFSRRQTLRPQVLDLGETLSELRMLLQRLIGERVTFDLVHGRDLWPVKADQSQIEQVIVNLVVNAHDAMPDGGKLTLKTSNVTLEESSQFAARFKSMQPGEYVEVEVADTGTGIPPEIIGRIFDPFFSTKEVGKGTGLGLSTVYGIVKQTGGFIYPESTVGSGTTFRIFLPRHIPEVVPAAAPAEAARAAPAAAAPADDTGAGTILLVEDEEGLRGLNARGLQSRGYTVLQAANGIEAIEAFESHAGAIDLVVSDVVMPEMDGPTLLTKLRARSPDVKIILVSGYAADAFARNLPPSEAYHFLAKPFTLKQLIGAVKTAIDK
jgi:two-component system cell cycle sensor histidine kinase/response regulator CckA